MATDVLVLSAVHVRHVANHTAQHRCQLEASDCTFEVAVVTPSGASPIAGNPVPGTKTVAFLLPPGTNALTLRIRAVPTGALAQRVWDVTAEVTYLRNGQWQYTTATGTQLSNPRSLHVDAAALGQGAVSSITVLLSPLRDVSEQVLAGLRNVPAGRFPPNPWPSPNNSWSRPWPPAPERWDTPELLDHTFIADPPVGGGAIRVARRTVDPSTLDVVFQVKGFVAPELVAVSYPTSRMPPGWPKGAELQLPRSEPQPFLIFIKPGSGQNQEGFFNNGAYPWGWDFLFFGLFRILHYTGDPVMQDEFAKGIAYQAEVSGKAPILVIPSTHGFLPDKDIAKRELRDLMDAEKVHSLLEEIQTYYSWWLSYEFFAPALGRVGLAAASQGATQLSFFLAANEKHAFCQDVLREVYLFDPHADDGNVNSGHVVRARAWAGSGSNPSDKMIRYYTQRESFGHNLLLNGTAGATGLVPPYVETKGTVTAAVLPESAWQAVRGGPLDAHNLIPAVMLTDALRRSAF
jgi:hypothetical protein